VHDRRSAPSNDSDDAGAPHFDLVRLAGKQKASGHDHHGNQQRNDRKTLFERHHQFVSLIVRQTEAHHPQKVHRPDADGPQRDGPTDEEKPVAQAAHARATLHQLHAKETSNRRVT